MHPAQAKAKRSLAAAAALLLLSASWAWPSSAAAFSRDKQAEQKHDGLIFGTVWDSRDQPVSGVRVKIRRAGDKKARWEVYSNQVGEFEQLVPAGKYVVWADVKRPKKSKKRGDQSHPWSPPQTTVQVDNDVRVDIGLHLTE